MKNKKYVLMISLLLMVQLTSANPSDPLSDGSFESGLNYWDQYDDVSSVSVPYSGSKSLKFDDASSGPAFVSQNINYRSTINGNIL